MGGFPGKIRIAGAKYHVIGVALTRWHEKQSATVKVAQFRWKTAYLATVIVMVIVTVLGLSCHSDCLEAPNRSQDTCPVQNPAQPKPAICCLKTYIDFLKNCYLCFPFYFVFLFINEEKTKDFRDPLLCFLDMSFKTMTSTTEVQTETVMNHLMCTVRQISVWSSYFQIKKVQWNCLNVVYISFLLPALIFISACSVGWFL